MGADAVVGVDPAKSMFQLHGAAADPSAHGEARCDVSKEFVKGVRKHAAALLPFPN